MLSFLKNLPWYSSGLAFECQQCGRCCAGPEEGYVWVSEKDITAIANYVGIPEPEFRKQYVRKVGNRHSLKEKPESNDCIFLTPDEQGGSGCRIYPVRPVQCRTWPFWSSNLATPQDWALAQTRCKGINRGELHSLESIEERRKATRE